MGDKISKMSDTFNTQNALFETKIEFSARDLDKEDDYPCDPTKKAWLDFFIFLKRKLSLVRGI